MELPFGELAYIEEPEGVASALSRLVYVPVDDGEPFGDALVQLPSMRMVMVRDYGSTGGAARYAVSWVGDGSALAALLEELLSVAGIPNSHVVSRPFDIHE